MLCVPVPEAFEFNLVWAYRDHEWKENHIYPLHDIGATFGGAGFGLRVCRGGKRGSCLPSHACEWE